jgi:hypothetical protein
MVGEPRVAPSRSFLWRSAVLGVVAALAFAACGDDGSSGAPNAGGGPEINAGATSSAGGRGSASGGVGHAGAPAPGSAGSAAGGEPGAAGDGAGSVTEADGISLDDFCELMTVRARQWLRDCRNIANAEDWWGTLNVTQLCSSGREAVEAGRLDYDPVQARACAALSVGSCDNVEALAYGIRAQQLQSNACAGVVKGVLGLGDECHPDSTNYADECAEGYCPPTACPSTCQAFAEADDDCDAVASFCDATRFFCNGEGKCQAFVAPGEPCPNRNECAPGDVCHSIDDQTALCTTPTALGQPCGPNDSCAEGGVCFEGECTAQVGLGEACTSSSHCPDGSFCNVTCRAFVELNGDCTLDLCGAGLTCVDMVCLAQGRVDDDCPCEEGLWCDEAEKCRAPGALDDACSMSDANSCPVPLFCHPQTLRCTEPAVENESCSMVAPSDSCQAELHCVCTQGCASLETAQGVCEPRGDVGTACTAFHDCASGVCAELECAADPLCY